MIGAAVRLQTTDSITAQLLTTFKGPWLVNCKGRAPSAPACVVIASAGGRHFPTTGFSAHRRLHTSIELLVAVITVSPQNEMELRDALRRALNMARAGSTLRRDALKSALKLGEPTGRHAESVLHSGSPGATRLCGA